MINLAWHGEICRRHMSQPKASTSLYVLAHTQSVSIEQRAATTTANGIPTKSLPYHFWYFITSHERLIKHLSPHYTKVFLTSIDEAI